MDQATPVLVKHPRTKKFGYIEGSQVFLVGIMMALNCSELGIATNAS